MRISLEYKEREAEIYDKIQEASDEFSRLDESGKDTTEALRRLELALRRLELFRKEYEEKY